MTDDELLQLITQASKSGVSQLDLSYNELTTLPREIGRLEQLVSLDLCGNDLVALPPEIGQLRFLTQLDLRHNQLAALPPELGLLTGLSSLDLRDNRLTKLPGSMEMMVNLKTLDLRDNRIQVFPQVILRLFGLEELHLYGNPLVALPLEIETLIRLRMLNLGGNTMPEIPEGVWRLAGLEQLVVDHTQVRSIPADVRYLRNLKYVELHNNRLGSLPGELGELSRLLTLIAHHNSITHLPPEIGALQRLTRLDVHHNQLVSLPVEIGKLRRLESLDLSENPLSIPPEILAKADDPTAILTYYTDHLDGRKHPLNEAKMVLVGQGGVGKSSLVRRLIHGAYDPQEPQTEGIAIEPWQIQVNDNDMQLNVWDFGGQEIMHATHQFFLTKRTLYLLVLDSRLTEEENRLEYWLKIIQSFGSDSPIILVGNKVDQQQLDLDRRGLRVKYPQIRAVMETSCLTGAGVDQLKARISREVTRMPHVRDALLASWFEVKREIEQMEKDYIPYESYLDLCREHGITDERSQRTLIGFLHDLGIVLNFQDDPRLEDTNILNPRWVTNGVYRILNDERLRERHGRLDRADLDQILDPTTYPHFKHQFILDMMRKFELCFPFQGGNEQQFLVPDLLSKEAPVSGHWQDALAFQYHYNVLPGSVLSRFIVRMHPYLYEDIYWRNGALVADQANVALVQADKEERRVSIWVRGPERGRRALLSIIRFHFEVIHSSIPGIHVEEKVPLPDHPEIVVDYQYLLDLEAMGEKRFVPAGLRQRVEVRALLDGVDLAREQEAPVRLRRILVERFNTEELRTLCYDLGVSFDELGGTNRAGKARELVAYLARRERLGDLLRTGKQLRSDIDWGVVPAGWA
ncbi:MAG: GTP-binding protein [Anaerolineae bacterium]|nr:GTP-binding protein [Anaerolineae bacterium]